MIPKIIHYVWLGKREKPESVKRCIKTWKEHCPDFKFVEWNENNFDINCCEYTKRAYELGLYAFVSDYIRVKVLNRFGGIYLDTDVEVRRPLNNLLKNDFFCGFENDVMLLTAVLGSDRQNGVLSKLESYYNSIEYKDKRKNRNIRKSYITNVILLSVIIKKEYKFKLNNKYQTKNIMDSSITLYPTKYFCAKDYVTKKMTVTKDTYTIHHYTSSWLSKKNKREDKIVYGIYKVFGDRLFKVIEKIFLKFRVKKYTKRIKKKGV